MSYTFVSCKLTSSKAKLISRLTTPSSTKANSSLSTRKSSTLMMKADKAG